MALAFNEPNKIAEEFADPETHHPAVVDPANNPLGIDPEKWW